MRGASARMAELIDALLELSHAMRAELQQAPVDIGLPVDWAHAELADADAGRDARIDVQPGLDRKSVVSGKSVSVRVELGGSRIITKTHHTTPPTNPHRTKTQP